MQYHHLNHPPCRRTRSTKASIMVSNTSKYRDAFCIVYVLKCYTLIYEICFVLSSFKTLFCDLDLSMLFAILRHLPCTDYMKWNRGELCCYRVWFSKDEDDCLLLGLYMCRCKEWLNINLVRSYNTALLKEMRYVYLVSQTVLPLSYVCTHTLTRGKGLAL